MRKKSHIILGRYLSEKLNSRDLRFHKKAFCFGNVLPDLRPSFVTVRHEYEVTFDMICDTVRRLAEECSFIERYTAGYWIKLGEVAHHVADYFTFPHNEHFAGTFVEHNCYEGELKNRLKEYILSGEASEHVKKEVQFDSCEEIISFIRKAHDIYMMNQRQVEEDIQFIVAVCFQVIQGVIRLMEEKFEEKFAVGFVPEFV